MSGTELSEQELAELLELRKMMLSISPNYKNCPHCGEGIEIVAENCKIFICGAMESKASSAQAHPHDEKGAEQAKQTGKLKLGCGKQCELIQGELRPCTGK